MAIVTLRYWAAAKDAAGVAEEKVDAPTLAAALAEGLAAARDRPGDRAGRLRLVLARSSFLVNGEPAGTRRPGVRRAGRRRGDRGAAAVRRRVSAGR